MTRITLLIAHRLSTVMHVDMGIKGPLSKRQPRCAAPRKGLYYAMWRQQIGERPTAQAPFTLEGRGYAGCQGYALPRTLSGLRAASSAGAALGD